MALRDFFNSDNFMPHGHCFLWDPSILWLHVVSDAGIAFSYYLIPVILFYLVKKRKDLPYRALLAAFSTFILLCGTTHLMAIWVLWHPDYALEGVLKALTAMVSLATAVILWKVVPRILHLIASPDSKEREAQFQRLANALPQLAWMADEKGGIVWYNDRWYEYTGTTPEAMKGWGWQSVHDKEKLPLVMAKWQASIFTGKAFEMIFPLRGKDGTFRQFLTRINPIHDKNGKIIQWFGTNTDIDDQYNSEAKAITALRQEEQERTRLLALIEDAPDFIGMADLEGKLLYHNRAARRMVGLPEDQDMSRLKMSDMHPEWAARRIREEGIPAIYDKGVWRSETALRHQDGHEIPVSQMLMLYRNQEGNPVCITTIMQDISERKRLDLLKNEFIANVSHELRTPLTSIRGSLGLVMAGIAGVLPEKGKGLIDIAYKNSERLILLINDILDVERLESGQMHFQLQPHAIEPLLRQAVELNKPYAEKYNVTLLLAADLPRVKMHVDADRFLQVMANLLSNAAKFSEAGGTVEISAQVQGRHVHIAVKDDGIGISEAFLPHIFAKFSQADSSETKVKGGSGLGLNITKSLVERMGGSICFESREKQGATFIVMLPAEPDTQQ